MDKFSKSAKEIIDKILYITIASVSKDNLPWNTPVYSAFDEEYNFYWCSDRESLHSRNIDKNENIAIVIYDSTAPAGEGNGVYIKAIAAQIISEDEIIKAHSLLVARDTNYPWTVDELKGDNRPCVYKAVPETFWMNIDGEVDGNFIDTRVKVHVLKS